ncbi:TPA: hypothetical protein QDB45_001742 [Burkholderia vietnamiensis]|nr:hypothetical protein [Burkholderia vietnamiensis]
MTTTQTLSIVLPENFDPLPGLTTESVRAHLTATRNLLAEIRGGNTRLDEERSVLDLMIGRIDNAPSSAPRDYLMALLREATVALQRRDSMNNDEAAYESPAELNATARQQLRMKHIRAERQMRLNWARSTREQLEEAAEIRAREAAEREAVSGAVEGILNSMNDALDGMVQAGRAKTTGTAAVPDLTKLVETMSLETPTLRPRVRMGF